jgi:hypothetical protein
MFATFGNFFYKNSYFYKGIFSTFQAREIAQKVPLYSRGPSAGAARC